MRFGPGISFGWELDDEDMGFPMMPEIDIPDFDIPEFDMPEFDMPEMQFDQAPIPIDPPVMPLQQNFQAGVNYQGMTPF